MVWRHIVPVRRKHLVLTLRQIGCLLLLESGITDELLKVQRPIFDHDIKFPPVSVFIRCRQDSPSQIGLKSVKHDV
jgi:hypothetical protein